jgi:hypothetical protein
MTKDRIEKIEAKMSMYIQELIDKAYPIFESLKTIEEVDNAVIQLDRAYDGGLKAIENSIYNLTEEQRTELNYIYDLKFSAVYDLAQHRKYMITYHE